MDEQVTALTFRNDIDVKLIRHMASDDVVIQAAQVSVKGENNPETDSPRLINYLMGARHGSPFEHAVFTCFVKAPLFVFREWHRHRIASYNEMSGRYTELLPEFYLPSATRPLVNLGNSARPEFGEGTPDHLRQVVNEAVLEQSRSAWKAYQAMLGTEPKVANEVARIVLPLNIYSQMYCTMNARAVMNFLSLRVDSPDATFRTRPQLEIQMGAEKVEEIFAELMPHTYASFIANGRVAP